MSAGTFSDFLGTNLKPVSGEPVESISWTPGTTQVIDDETFMEKLEILPPRWQSGNRFAFGEGSGSFSIFWKLGKVCFVTHLDDADTEDFCRLARVRLHQ